MERVLGLDSGGTKTIAAVVDRSGQVVTISLGAGLDPTADSDWEARLGPLIEPLGRVSAAVLGLPFHGEIPKVTARQIVLAKALIGPQAQVMNDVAVAFEGALGGHDGVLILAGTGSMAWARGRLGMVRVGGWGDAFGDEGSAYWIGREALALVSQHLDGRASGAEFTAGLLQRLGIAPDTLIDWTYQQRNLRAGLAGVAQHVSALAGAGQPDARALMLRAAGHLALLGQTAAQKCGASAPLWWSYAGGVFDDTGLRDAVAAKLGSAPQKPVLPPVGGAVLCAARAAGWAVDDGFIDRLAQSLATELLQSSPQPQEVSR